MDKCNLRSAPRERSTNDATKAIILSKEAGRALSTDNASSDELSSLSDVESIYKITKSNLTNILNKRYSYTYTILCLVTQIKISYTTYHIYF